MRHMHSSFLPMSQPTYQNAAEIVSAARRSSGLSQALFATKIGRSQAVVSRYESGKVDPPATVMMRTMHILMHSTFEVSEIPAENDPKWLAVQVALVQLTKALQAVQPRLDA